MSEPEIDRRVAMRHKLSNPSYEIFMGLLSILSIVNLVLMLFATDPDLNEILVLINVVLTAFFALDFIFRLITAPSRRQYFFRDYGWADLLSSLPFAQTNILRLFRLIRVYRLMKEYGTRALGRALLKDRADSALFTLVFIAILVLEFGSLGMLKLESESADANITTASDSLWFMVVTMATVGYGDQFPVTNAGRVLGVLVILVGVGIFGTLTGYLANFFLSPSRGRSRHDEPDLQARLEALRELNMQQRQAIDELEALIQDRLDRPPAS
jgi:voltage-gated potassium channel